jgi:hypothetical protein
MSSSMHEDEFEDFLNERLDGSDDEEDDDEESNNIKTDSITASTVTKITNEKTVISAIDNGLYEEEDELEKLLSESEREDESLTYIKEKNLFEERKEESNEVVLQFWDEKEQNVINEDEEEEMELNQKLSSILIRVPKTRKRSISKESMEQKQQNTEATSNISSTTLLPVENSNPSEMDARKQRILEKQRQRQKLIQSLMESEEKNTILSKQLQARNQKLNLVKQKWKQERKMFLNLLKTNNIELDLQIQKELYNLNELDIEDDYGDISGSLLILSSQSALGAASGVLSSLISSFSQPIVQQQTNEKAEESEPQMYATEAAASEAPVSVIESFKGWIWGSSSTISTTDEPVNQKSSSSKKESTSRK